MCRISWKQNYMLQTWAISVEDERKLESTGGNRMLRKVHGEGGRYVMKYETDWGDAYCHHRSWGRTWPCAGKKGWQMGEEMLELEIQDIVSRGNPQLPSTWMQAVQIWGNLLWLERIRLTRGTEQYIELNRITANLRRRVGATLVVYAVKWWWWWTVASLRLRIWNDNCISLILRV